MKSFERIKLKRLFILSIFFFNIHIFSADLKSVKLNSHNRVATYIGTFNPLHIRHEEIIEGVLNSELVDYVVVLANDLNFHKPEALEYRHRMKMLWERFKDHPKVLVIKNLDDFPFPSVSSVTQYLYKTDVHLSGIMGLDSVLSFKTRLAAFFMKRSSWIVTYANPSNDLEKAPSNIAFNPIDYLQVPVKSADVRSTELRLKLSQGDYENLPLSNAVINYIKTENLYSNPAPKSSLINKISFCAQQLLYWAKAKF